MLFLGIISWKGASHFSGVGEGCFSDGGASFLSGGWVPWGGISFDGVGSHGGWGVVPPMPSSMGNPESWF